MPKINPKLPETTVRGAKPKDKPYKLYDEGGLVKPYSQFSDYEHTSTLSSLSDATQAIYLDMPSYYTWLERKTK